MTLIVLIRSRWRGAERVGDSCRWVIAKLIDVAFNHWKEAHRLCDSSSIGAVLGFLDLDGVGYALGRDRCRYQSCEEAWETLKWSGRPGTLRGLAGRSPSRREFLCFCRCTLSHHHRTMHVYSACSSRLPLRSLTPILPHQRFMITYISLHVSFPIYHISLTSMFDGLYTLEHPR